MRNYLKVSKNRKNIHKIDYKNEYLGHFAIYPDEFSGIVERKDTFCLQFAPTIATYRKFIGLEGELELSSDIPGTKNIRLSTNGTAFDTVGVRVTHKMSEELLKRLILAHKNAENEIFLIEIRNFIDKLLEK